LGTPISTHGPFSTASSALSYRQRQSVAPCARRRGQSASAGRPRNGAARPASAAPAHSHCAPCPHHHCQPPSVCCLACTACRVQCTHRSASRMALSAVPVAARSWTERRAAMLLLAPASSSSSPPAAFPRPPPRCACRTAGAGPDSAMSSSSSSGSIAVSSVTGAPAGNAHDWKAKCVLNAMPGHL